jgi:predicted nucleotidyltransferase
VTREKESRDGNKTQHRLSREASRLSGAQSAMKEAVSWPVVGTPVVADVQAPGFLPVTEDALSAIVERLVPALNPHKIIVFGSYVYGVPTPDSDVDLLVILDTQDRPVDRYLSVSRLLRPRPFPLDIVVKTPEEITRAIAHEEPFIVEILTQGRVLYERAS